jgi:hypothetical protein
MLICNYRSQDRMHTHKHNETPNVNAMPTNGLQPYLTAGRRTASGGMGS